MEKFKQENRNQLLLLPPSIEEFIPENHLARIINEVVNTIDTRSIEEGYSYLGQKSYSPKLLLKLMFYGYATGVRSGRKIATACETDTAFMYLSNMHKPDFRTINDFRKNNIAFVKDAFVQVLRFCKHLGMCKAGILIIDGTKLKANASAILSKTKEVYEKWLSTITNEVELLMQEVENNDKNEDAKNGQNRGDELPKELASKQLLKQRIEEIISTMYNENTNEVVNFTDTDAKFIRGQQGITTNYNCQTAISEDGIIISALTANNSSDRTQTIVVIDDAERNTEMSFPIILADSGYASYENYEKLERKNKIPYMPDQQMELDSINAKDNKYHRAHFIYDEEKDVLICPEEKELKYVGNYEHKKGKQKGKIYRCNECKLCDKINDCSKGVNRKIHVDNRETLRNKVRTRLKTKEGKNLYKKRMRIESIFGNIKHNLGIKHLYLKGLEKTTAEWQLICIGHNLKKIHQKKVA